MTAPAGPGCLSLGWIPFQRVRAQHPEPTSPQTFPSEPPRVNAIPPQVPSSAGAPSSGRKNKPGLELRKLSRGSRRVIYRGLRGVNFLEGKGLNGERTGCREGKGLSGERWEGRGRGAAGGAPGRDRCRGRGGTAEFPFPGAPTEPVYQALFPFPFPFLFSLSSPDPALCTFCNRGFCTTGHFFSAKTSTIKSVSAAGAGTRVWRGDTACV